MGEEQDKLARALARLRSLKNTLTEGRLSEVYEVSEEYVQEYHKALKHLSEVGFNIDEFSVPAKMLKRSVATSSYITDDVTYREGLWVERTFLVMKIDFVIGYFELQNGEDLATGKIDFKGKK